MKLTPIAAKNLKPKEKPFKQADGGGLYLEVFPNGSKLWRLKYRKADGSETRVSLGKFPDVSVADARNERERIKADRRKGIDPADQRRAIAAQAAVAAENTFEAVGREWLSRQNLSKATHDKAIWMFESLTFPWIGARPVAEITAPDMLALLRRIESRGKLETAQRVKQQAGRVFRYAIATGRAAADPTAALRGALATPKTRHRASITDPAKIGPLLRALDGYSGAFVTACALKLAPLLFVRPGELRHAEWSEFDLDAGEWRIPAAKMKMRAVHIVPLSVQAVAILRDLLPLTGPAGYLFPSVRSGRAPMSENTVVGALRRLGYAGDEMSGHGFRSMASTRLHEMGWPHDAIERQLAHAERNKVSAAYNYAEHLPERRKMMQAWADYLDVLREDRKVIAGNFGRAA